MTYLQSEVRSSPEVKLSGDPEFPRCFRPSNCASSDALLHLQKEKRSNQNMFDIRFFKFAFSCLGNAIHMIKFDVGFSFLCQKALKWWLKKSKLINSAHSITRSITVYLCIFRVIKSI